MTIASSLTCPRCGGDIEFDVERDGSAWVRHTPLLWTTGSARAAWTRAQTTCGCVWTADEVERLHEAAQRSAAEREREAGLG